MPTGQGLYDDENADEREKQKAVRDEDAVEDAPDATTEEDAPEPSA